MVSSDSKPPLTPLAKRCFRMSSRDPGGVNEVDDDLHSMVGEAMAHTTACVYNQPHTCTHTKSTSIHTYTYTRCESAGVPNCTGGDVLEVAPTEIGPPLVLVSYGGKHPCVCIVHKICMNAVCTYTCTHTYAHTHARTHARTHAHTHTQRERERERENTHTHTHTEREREHTHTHTERERDTHRNQPPVIKGMTSHSSSLTTKEV